MTRASKARQEQANLLLPEFLPYRIAVVARAISNELAQRYSDSGITNPEWRVIAHLADVVTCSSGDICQRTSMDKATVNRALGRLVAGGLVLAEVSSQDRRLNVLTLTARGKALHQVIVPLALDVEAQLTETLTPEEKAVLFRAISKLDRRVEDIRLAREASTLNEINASKRRQNKRTPQ